MDPFGDVEEVQKEKSGDVAWDIKAYERWRDNDEKILIQCLIETPGKEGCTRYEVKRSRK